MQTELPRIQLWGDDHSVLRWHRFLHYVKLPTLSAIWIELEDHQMQWMADPTESSWETATWNDSDTTLLFIAVHLDIPVSV